MAANDYVRARIDRDLKEEAALVLDSLGLTISDVMRMMLTRIAREKSLPIELTRPNAETIAAIEEARALKKTTKDRFSDSTEILSSLEST